MADDKPVVSRSLALKEQFDQVVANMPKTLDASEILKRAAFSTHYLGRGQRSPGPDPRTEQPQVVRFARLNGCGEETIDLHQCLRFLVGVRAHAESIQVDPSTVTVFYLTPTHRGILGLGGLLQIQRGGDGYQEVHPLRIAHDMHLFGMKLPPELQRYRPFLAQELTLNESISAWNESIAEPNQVAEPHQDKDGSPGCTDEGATNAQRLDDLTQTAWKLLRAIRQLGAINAETAKNRPTITSKANTGNHDSKHNQIAFKKLVDSGLTASRKNVGTWLKEAGIAALEKRSISG